MEPGQLKAVLYDNLQKRGILENLKTQLRHSLVRELQSLNRDDDVVLNRKSPNLRVQVINNLVAEYLRCHGYEYSLSTFCPEANIDVERLLPHNEILEALKIHGLEYNQEDRDGLLYYILTHIPSEGHVDKTRGMEKRLLSFQHECEARSKKQLELEMARFREKETSLMRIEEKNIYQKKLGELREQIEAQYKQKMSVAAREYEGEREHLKQKEQDLDSTLYMQRQALLEEMEVLKMRESELKRQTENSLKATSLEHQKTLALQELLESKDQLINDLKEQYHSMTDAKMERYKIESEAKHSQELMEMRQELQEQVNKCAELQKLYDSSKAPQVEADLKQQLKHSAARYEDLLRQKDLLLNENKALLDRISELERAVKQLKEINLAERVQLNRGKNVGVSLNQPVGQLDQETKDLKHEVMALQFKNKQLQKELVAKHEASTQLQQTVDEQTLQLYSTSRELHDLQDQVNYLHTVLATDTSNKCLKTTHPKSVDTLIDDSSLPLSGGNHGDTLRNLSSSSTCSHGNSLLHDASYSDASAMLLAEARATFARMDEESRKLAGSLRYGELYNVPPTVRHINALPSVHTSASPIINTSVPPTVHTSAPPIIHTTALPTVHTNAPPTVHTSALPIVYTSVPPTVYNSAPPTVHTSALPTVYTSAPPTVCTSAPPTVHTSALPTAHTSALPIVHTSALPTVYTSAPPTVCTSAPPIVHTSALPTVHTSAPPTVPQYSGVPLSTTVLQEAVVHVRSHGDVPVTTSTVPIVATPIIISDTPPIPATVSASVITSHDSHVTKHDDHMVQQLLQEEWLKKREEKQAQRRREEELEKERVRRALEELQNQDSITMDTVNREQESVAMDMVAKEPDTLSEGDGESIDPLMKQYMERVLQSREETKLDQPGSHTPSEDASIKEGVIEGQSDTDNNSGDPFSEW